MYFDVYVIIFIYEYSIVFDFEKVFVLVCDLVFLRINIMFINIYL